MCKHTLLVLPETFSQGYLTPSDHRCTNTAAWNVSANFQGDGVSGKRENCAQRPRCQKLHVSGFMQYTVLLHDEPKATVNCKYKFSS